MATEYEKRHLVDWLRAEMTRQAGRRYLIDLESLDLKNLRELQRLLRDLADEAQRTAQRARMFPGAHHSQLIPSPFVCYEPMHPDRQATFTSAARP